MVTMCHALRLTLGSIHFAPSEPKGTATNYNETPTPAPALGYWGSAVLRSVEKHKGFFLVWDCWCLAVVCYVKLSYSCISEKFGSIVAENVSLAVITLAGRVFDIPSGASCRDKIFTHPSLVPTVVLFSLRLKMFYQFPLSL
jgi:hypothetical protein